MTSLSRKKHQTTASKTLNRINEAKPQVLVFYLTLCLLSVFSNISWAQYSGPQKQEPPKFQKPTSFRYILGVRNNSGYGRNTSGNVRGNSGYGSAQKRSTNSRLLNVQYQIEDSGSQPIGSGVRRTVSHTQEEPITKQVDPINDPFGDLSDPGFHPTKRYTKKTNSFVVPVQNQQSQSDFRPVSQSPVNRTSARPPQIHQDSILRRPDNSPIQSRPISRSKESSDRFSLEPRSRGGIQNQVPQDQSVENQEAPINRPMNTLPMNKLPMSDSPKVQEGNNDPMVERPMTSPMDNSLRQDTDPMQESTQDEPRQKYELDCEELKGVLFKTSVREISLNLTPKVKEGKDVPQFCDFDVFPAPDRCWCPQSFLWTASAACSKPLYFQHIQLERYGHSRGPIIQPVLSAAHFFGNVAIYPYKAGIHPYNECMYALGYYRPGDCAPWLREPWPWSVKGAASQAASAVGYTGVFR